MADKTPADGVLSGFLIPWAFSADHANDHARETDYTEGDRRAIRPTQPAGQNIILEPSGDAEAGAAASYFVRYTRAGVPRPNGARPVYSTTSGGTFTGANRPGTFTHWQRVSSTAARGMSTARLDNGKLICGYWADLGAVHRYYVRTRSSSGSWSGAVIVATVDDALRTYAAGCVVVPDDGNPLFIYADRRSNGGTYAGYLAVSRSTDDGTTWTTQTKDAAGGKLTGGTDFRRMQGTVINGTIVVFLEFDESGSPKTYQYNSTDGGITFEEVSNTALHLGGVGKVGRYLLVSTITELSDTVVIRRSGAASVSVWDDAGTSLGGGSTDGDDHTGATFLTEPSGRVWHLCNGGANNRLDWSYSDDYGATWLVFNDRFEFYQGQNEAPIEPAATWLDDRGILLFTIGDTGSGPPATRTDGLHEVCLGGRSDVTWTQQTTSWGNQESIDWPEDAATWLPIELLNTGWGTNTGTSTWSALDANGQTITSTSGQEGTNTETIGAFGSDTGGGVFFAIVEQRGSHGDGHTYLRIKMSDSGGTNGCTFTLYLSSTRYTWTGGTTGPTWASSHNFANEIAVLIAVSLTDKHAYAWIADASDRTAPLTWTALGQKTNSTAGAGNTEYTIGSKGTGGSGAISDIQALAMVCSEDLVPDLAGGFSNPADLDGLSLGTTIASLLDKGISLRSTGGIAYATTDEQEIVVRGKRPKEHTLPRESPSPSRGYRSGGTSASPLATTLDLRYTFDTDNEAAMRVGSDVFGIYLGNLYGVETVTIKDNGVTVATVDITTTFTATRTGNSVYPVESGSDAQGVYVLHGEYANTSMDLGSGVVRKVVSNTAGTLQEGVTVDTSRAVFELAGVAGGDPTSFTATIHPRECLILVYGRTTWQRLDIVIPSADAVPDEGYREIGIVAAGPVAVCGYKNDRNSRTEWQDGVELITAKDGTRRGTVYHQPRRMVEASWINSHRDVYSIRQASTTAPDYVVADQGGSPAALRDDVTLLIPEVYRAINGKADPVVWIPYLPTSSSTTEALKTGRAAGAIYGRIVTPIRQERAGTIGVINTSDAYSVSTLTIEEEI